MPKRLTRLALIAVAGGGNYGWPRVTGDDTQPGLTPPVGG